MKHLIGTILVVCLYILPCNKGFAIQEPQPVPRLTERALEKASYIELSRQWKDYIKTHGESSRALVNLSKAYRYSGEEKVARLTAERAVKIAPDDPEALTLLGKMLSLNHDELMQGLKLLKRCREIAPDYAEGLESLAAIYLKIGELEKSEEIFKTIFEQNIIPRPLIDYGYNMIAGLPQGAVLVTNGDNDTFPPLALQAGMGFRKDVVVINRSILNLKEYASAIFSRYPDIKPGGKLKPEGNLSISGTLLKRMIKEARIPMYFAVSVDFENLGFTPKLKTEGLNKRAAGKGLDTEASAKLFLYTYRLDSATDWSYSWDLIPAVSNLMMNYVVCMVELTEEENLSVQSKHLLLESAMSIAKFHEMKETIINRIRLLQHN